MPQDVPSQDSGLPIRPAAGRKAISVGLWIVKGGIVVVAAGVLLAILLPTSLGPRKRSSAVKCASNLRQIGQSLNLYANDHKCYPRIPSGAGEFGQLNPAASKDTTTADPQFDLDTVLIPKF